MEILAVLKMAFTIVVLIAIAVEFVFMSREYSWQYFAAKITVIVGFTALGIIGVAEGSQVLPILYASVVVLDVVVVVLCIIRLIWKVQDYEGILSKFNISNDVIDVTIQEEL